MPLLDRALRMGEGKKFKEYERRVTRINAFEEEFSLFDDDEIRATADQLRARARGTDEPARVAR